MPDPMSPAAAPRDAAGDYLAPATVFDEFKDAAGQIRAPWNALPPSLIGVGREAIRDRREGARQLLKEHGVTYNVYADGQSDERPWNLDILPLVLGAHEWSRLRAGLEQRTRLLDLILRDLYGPQRLVRDRLIPPALVHANPGFLRP